MKNHNLFLVFAALFSFLFSTNSFAIENIQVGTTTRTMIVYAPKGIPENRPLVISMHGSNQDAAYQQAQAKWEAIADTAKFIVVYPNGINKQWDISGTSDTNFLLTVIDSLYSRYKIDRKRVYLSGFSMGGMMTYYAATKIADKIAAFAPISGYLMGGPNTNSSRPIPIIHTHGTTDDVVVYSGVQTCLNAWIARNGCSTTPEFTKPYPASNPNSVASKTYWGNGTNGVEIVLMSLTGKGHWVSIDPVGGINTSLEIWNFVKRYTLGVVLPGSGTGGTVIAPPSVLKKYDFSNDTPTTTYVSPGLNTTMGIGSTTTAGVVSYTDANNHTANALSAFSGGQRNATGVVNLNLFSRKSTDYSVTWKQCLGSGAKDYKVGVLLRGDTAKIADETTGYVQGLMQGYLFIVYSAITATTPHSEFRIYKTSGATTTAMSAAVNTTVTTLVPTAGQPVWYRASVSGSTWVSLKLEYSTDSITWNTGSSYGDSTTPFTSGATQFVWGLGVDNKDFYINNITFYGVEKAPSTTALVQPRIDASAIASKEYYTITGMRVENHGQQLRGLYIVQNHLLDGSVISTKVFYK